eukprot:TRINITY_DN3560_c0_g1_i1.p1 TRINITY_DN3560_c0_g1~~TRINITY_DN3560_c0_g1_i1.p1  ORF type:complete len:643 (+),score=152.06 TRINITY_DN3560_c0_g1_i1:2-1930(+)
MKVTCLLSLFILLSSSQTITSDITDTIGYQVHSWNDLREWQQGFRKGVRWMKIDPAYEEVNFCQNQTRVASHDPRGCLLLNHDDPIESRTDYFTLNDVLNFISEPSNRHFFQGDEIHIALCFKNITPCDGSLDSQNWESLVDEFFNNAVEAISSLNLSIEFILDGAATPNPNRLCLKDKWRPWISTWIPYSDAWGALFADFEYEAFDRFQILNMPVWDQDSTIVLRSMADLDYGKFLGNSYPFLNWEPSDQLPIQQVAQLYISEQTPQQAGFRFAINIDPVQLEVYVGSQSRKAWNFQIPNSGNYDRMFLIPIPGIQHDVLMVGQAQDVTSYSISSSSNLFEPLFNLKSGTLGNLGELTSLSAFKLNDTTLTAISDTQHVAIFKLKDAGLVETSKIASIGSILDVKLGAHNDSTISVWVLTGDASCGGIVSQYLFQVENHVTLENRYCLGLPSKLLSGSLVSHGNQIYVFWEDPSSHVWISTWNGVSPVKFGHKKLGVGSKPSASLLEFGGKTYILEVHTGGFCWNTAYRNKRANVSLCDSTPVSIPNVLIYNYGTLDDWQHVVNNTDMGDVSSCNVHLLHGMYDMGTQPHMTVFPAVYHQTQVMVAMEVHRGIESSVDEGGCGSAIPYEGYIMDGWILPFL